MWNLLSRLIHYTYGMIFRLSRQVFLWTSRLRGIEPKPAFPPPKCPSTKLSEVSGLLPDDKHTVIEMDGQSQQPPENLMNKDTLTTENPKNLPFQLHLSSVEIKTNSSPLNNCVQTAQQDNSVLTPSAFLLSSSAQSVSFMPAAKATSFPQSEITSGSSIVSCSPNAASESTVIKSAGDAEILLENQRKKTKFDISTTKVEEEVVQPISKRQKLKSRKKNSKKSHLEDFVVQEGESPNQLEPIKEKHKKSNKSSKRKREGEHDECAENFQEDTRPNFFVAFQVLDKDIKSKVMEVQENMLIKEVVTPSVLKFSNNGSIFKDTMIPVDKLHFTLHVFHLRTDQVEQAKAVLEKCFDQFKEAFKNNPVRVNIEGLGHFRNSVIFAKIKDQEHISRLELLCSVLRTEYDAINIIGDSKNFKPHLTIAKMSRSKKLHKKKIRSFPSEIWSEFESEHFGFQKVESLQLLSMTETDPATGYYRCVSEFWFEKPSNSASTSKSETNQLTP